MSRYRTIVADPPWDQDGTLTPWQKASDKREILPYGSMTVPEIAALPVRDLAAAEGHLYLWTTNQYVREAYTVAASWGFEPMYLMVWCKPSQGVSYGGKFASNVEFVLFCRERDGARRVAASISEAAERAGLGPAEINRRMGVARMAMWWLGRASGDGAARVPTPEQWDKLKSFLPLGDEHDEDVVAANEMRADSRKCGTRWWQWPRSAHSSKPEAFLDLVESVSPGPYLEMFARRARFGWDYWGDESLGTANLGEAA